MRKIFIIIIALFCFFSSGVFAEENGNGYIEKKHLAVLNFTAEGLPASYAGVVRNYLEIALHSINAFTILEREQIQKAIKVKSLEQYGCNEPSCGQLIGKTLSADFIIIGKTRKVNDVYSAAVTVISVENGDELFSYSEKYDSIPATKPATQKIAEDLTRDLLDYLAGKKPGQVPRQLSLGAGVSFVLPLGLFAELVEPGFGVTMELGFENLLPGSFRAGFQFSLAFLDGSMNEDDRCLFVPFQVFLSYSFSFSEKFSCTPVMALGFVYISLRHGSGSGFDIPEFSSKSALEPSAQTGLSLSYHYTKTISIEITGIFGVLFEKDSMVMYTAYYLGSRVVF